MLFAVNGEKLTGSHCAAFMVAMMWCAGQSMII